MSEIEKIPEDYEFADLTLDQAKQAIREAVKKAMPRATMPTVDPVEIRSAGFPSIASTMPSVLTW